MIRVVGVRFRNVGKIYYFSPKNLQIEADDHVLWRQLEEWSTER